MARRSFSAGGFAATFEIGGHDGRPYSYLRNFVRTALPATTGAGAACNSSRKADLSFVSGRFLAIAGILLLAVSTLWSAPKTGLQISSPAFAAGGDIPTQFSCKGDNMNPPLEIHGVPAGAKSLLLILDDPDAPRGLFTHWIVWNIAPSTSGIAQKSVPGGGVEGTNDFGKKGYGGPCPPAGTHRYFFHVFALDQQLDLPAGAKRNALNKAMTGHIVAQGELMGRFSH